jgi:anion-transporting  ArsA/GET3 family ATPase
MSLAPLFDQRRVLVCCGAGGVGKTTVSASLALAAARAGKRVLVLTVDPSKRLAETLGVARNPPAPVSVSTARLAALGVKPPGSLAAWMLDPQLVSDRVVERMSKAPKDAERLLANPIYRNVSAMVAGMQEYTAVEAMHDFVRDDTYDLVVLDTPPSRDALRFLDAPDRVGAFLDKRIFNLFVPGEGGMIRRMASRLLERVMDTAFGEETRRDLQTFFELFGGILSSLNRNQGEMRAFFKSDAVGFLLVTSPREEALTEAFFFERRTRDELGMHLDGYVLNRSMAWAADRPMPAEVTLPTQASETLRAALAALTPYAEAERTLADGHASLAKDLQARTGADGRTLVLPMLPDGASALEGLSQLANALVEPSPETLES